MTNSIVLVPVPGDMPTSYMRGGRTRERTGDVPVLEQVLTVGQYRVDRWRLSPATCEAWVALNAKWVSLGGEPIRITDCSREPERIAHMRAGYLAWRQGGRPSPEDPQWRRGMRMAFVAPPNGSNHQWGGAIDFDVGALYMPGLGRGTDEVLAELWDAMRPLGFSPIIRHPIREQSESWHLDHWGSLGDVYHELRKTKRRAYNAVALMGCALAGRLSSDLGHHTERYIQARLSVAGYSLGEADGIIGPKTRKALEAAGCSKSMAGRARRDPARVVTWMNEAEVGMAAIAQL